MKEGISKIFDLIDVIDGSDEDKIAKSREFTDFIAENPSFLNYAEIAAGLALGGLGLYKTNETVKKKVDESGVLTGDFTIPYVNINIKFSEKSAIKQITESMSVRAVSGESSSFQMGLFFDIGKKNSVTFFSQCFSLSDASDKCETLPKLTFKVSIKQK